MKPVTAQRTVRGRIGGIAFTPGVLALLAVLCASSSAVASARPARSRTASAPIIAPGQSVHLAGTDLYAEVENTKRGVALYGERFPKGAKVATGYFFVAQDSGVAVGERAGDAVRYVFERAQPSVHVSLAPSANASGVVTVRSGWSAGIGGTALRLEAGPDKSGEPALVSVLGSGSAPVTGSYLVGITDHGVAVGRWRGSSATLVYQVANRARPLASPAPSTTKPSTTSTTKPATPSKTKIGALGTTLSIDGIQATLVAVANDAKPRTIYDRLPSDSEVFDTATVRLTNRSRAHFVGASNAAIVIVGSDNKTYMPDIEYGVAGCGDFGSGGATGTFDIPPGATQTGCVHVIVPAGVKVALVGFSPGGDWVSGGYVAWTP